MKIFAERELREYLLRQQYVLRDEIQAENKNRLLNMNETEYVAYVVNRYRVDPLVFDWDSRWVSDREDMIPAEKFPFGFNVYEGKRYPKQVITYHLPYGGEDELLKCQPSSCILWTTEVRIENNHVVFDIINWRDNSDEIKREADHILNNIRSQANNIDAEVAVYNQELEGETKRIVQERKAALLKQMNLMASLGVPVKAAQGISPTFAVPVTPKRVALKPSAPDSPFSPQPALDESTYGAILQIVYDSGVEMERHPSIYSGKDEEALRDYFIMVLAPHFQSVTGETFNKAGKTDILIRHEKANVFVAECKFWKGMKAFSETIDQILSYLTWRDSKAAIVLFIQNKELDPVLQQIQTETTKHSGFVKFNGKKSEGWFNFEFHLKGDHTRSVRLAVLCFHFP